MLYPYMRIIRDSTNIVYSDLKHDGAREYVNVYFERPAKDQAARGFDSMDIALPNGKMRNIIGFTEQEARYHEKNMLRLQDDIIACAREESMTNSPVQPVMENIALTMPAPMADYLSANQLDSETELQSYCMMLYPLMRKGKLTHKQVARLLNVTEETVNFIYDYYELPHRLASTQDYAASEERINQAFRHRYQKANGLGEEKHGLH